MKLIHRAILSLLLVPLALPAQQLRATPQMRVPGPTPAAAATAAQRPADYVVALVNSEPITNNEVVTRMLRTEQAITREGGVLPPRVDLARQALEQLISERAQIQFARESGIKIDEASLDSAVANIAAQNGIDVAELQRRLKAEGGDYATFRAEVRDRMLLQRVREREVEPRTRVTEQDIDQFIREQRESNDLSTQDLNLAQVLVAVPESASPAQVEALRARAQRAFDRARAGEDFSALAREYSDGPERNVGGQFGLRPADRYPQLFIDTTRALPVGGVAAPVRSGAGFHVLKVIDRRQSGLPAVNVTQTRARHILLRTGPQLSESAAIARLNEMREQISQKKADFAALAREHSQDGSARQGGDLGWANPGQFVPEFEQALAALSPGQIGPPLVSRFGVHLIEVLERRQAQLSEREQRDIARSLLMEKKAEEAYANWAQEVRGRAFVQMREAPQ